MIEPDEFIDHQTPCEHEWSDLYRFEYDGSGVVLCSRDCGSSMSFSKDGRYTCISSIDQNNIRQITFDQESLDMGIQVTNTGEFAATIIRIEPELLKGDLGDLYMDDAYRDFSKKKNRRKFTDYKSLWTRIKGWLSRIFKC